MSKEKGAHTGGVLVVRKDLVELERNKLQKLEDALEI